MSALRYLLSIAVSGPLTGAPFAQILAGARSVRVRRIGIRVNVPATDLNIGLVRPATLGTATTTTVPAASRTQDQVAVVGVQTAWSAAPTIAGSPIYLVKETTLAGATARISWRFDEDELWIRGGAGLLLWNFGAGTSPAVGLDLALDEVS